MPRLPRTPLYEVQNAQNNTRVTPIQRVSGEDAVGAALGKQGEAAFEIGSRIREAQITNEVAKAHNELNLKLDAEYRQLEKDTGDPTELEAKWQERSKAILAETSGGMSSPMHRRLFDAQAAQLAEGYQIKTRDLTRKKQVDGAIADSARQLDALSELAADPEISLDVLQQNTDTTLAAARRLRKAGFINEQQLAEWEVKAGDQLMVGKSVRNEKRVSDLMDAGDAVSIAQARLLMEDKDFRADLLPERREALDDALKVKAQAADAFGRADQLMAEADGDYGKAIEGAREIKDPELRQDVESRLTTMKEQDNQARILRQRDVQDAGMEVLLTGKGISSIPADVYASADAKTKEYWQDHVYQQAQRRQSMATLSAQEKAALREYEGYVTKSIEGFETTDPELFVQGPVAWKSASPVMYERYISLGLDDQKAIDNKIEKLRTDGKQASTVDTVYKQLLAEAKRAIPEMAGKNAEDKKWYAELTGRLRTAAETEAKESGGKPITVTRVREIVGTEGGTVMKGGGWFSKAKPLYEADPEVLMSGNDVERRRAALSILSAEPVYARAARTTLAGKGIDKPTDPELALEALRLKSADEREQLQEGMGNTLQAAGDMAERMIGVTR